MITAESFGSDLPKNWEEIAKFVNNAAEKWLDDLRKDDPEYFESHDESCIYYETFEAFWDGEFADAPIVEFDEQQIATE